MTTSLRWLSGTLVVWAMLAGGVHAAGVAATFQSLDVDHDGLLSRAELRDHPRLLAHFDAIDTNHDGLLSNDELQAWHAAHLHPPGSEGQAFTQLDANGDGQVRRSEVPRDARAQAWFDAADTNRDGVVTKEEARVAREARRAAKAAGMPPASAPR